MSKPDGLPIAEKYKSMDSDEDNEEPQNEAGTSSTSQPFVPVLPLHQGQQAVHRDQLPAPNLVTKTVRKEMSRVHEVRTLEGQCFIQDLLMNIGQ